METLRLTESDYGLLLYMLGFAYSGHLEKHISTTDGMTDLIDWILLQANSKSHLYRHNNDRDSFRKLKEEEIANDDIPITRADMEKALEVFEAEQREAENND